jgi:hypothetical protein
VQEQSEYIAAFSPRREIPSDSPLNTPPVVVRPRTPTLILPQASILQKDDDGMIRELFRNQNERIKTLEDTVEVLIGKDWCCINLVENFRALNSAYRALLAQQTKQPTTVKSSPPVQTTESLLIKDGRIVTLDMLHQDCDILFRSYIQSPGNRVSKSDLVIVQSQVRSYLVRKRVRSYFYCDGAAKVIQRSWRRRDVK